MKFTNALALTSAYVSAVTAVTGQLGDAAPVLDNPAGAAYEARISKNGIRGRVVASTDPSTGGVNFAVDFANLPTEGGPFLYHIHVAPVPESGNCTETLAHLDPYIRGEAEPCDPTMPATCQVGDLSGKHGKINGTYFNASYIDPYPALKPGIGAFFGNRSIVLHFANKTRIACANFVSQSGMMAYPGPYDNSSMSSSSMMPVSSSMAAASSSSYAMPTTLASSSAKSSASATTSSGAAQQTTNGADRVGMLPATMGCASLAMVMGWFML